MGLEDFDSIDPSEAADLERWLRAPDEDDDLFGFQSDPPRALEQFAAESSDLIETLGEIEDLAGDALQAVELLRSIPGAEPDPDLDLFDFKLPESARARSAQDDFVAELEQAFQSDLPVSEIDDALLDQLLDDLEPLSEPAAPEPPAALPRRPAVPATAKPAAPPQPPAASAQPPASPAQPPAASAKPPAAPAKPPAAPAKPSNKVAPAAAASKGAERAASAAKPAARAPQAAPAGAAPRASSAPAPRAAAPERPVRSAVAAVAAAAADPPQAELEPARPLRRSLGHPLAWVVALFCTVNALALALVWISVGDMRDHVVDTVHKLGSWSAANAASAPPQSSARFPSPEVPGALGWDAARHGALAAKPAFSHRRFLEGAAWKLEQQAFEEARAELYGLLAQIDAVEIGARAAAEAQANYLIGESYRLEAASSRERAPAAAAAEVAE